MVWLVWWWRGRRMYGGIRYGTLFSQVVICRFLVQGWGWWDGLGEQLFLTQKGLNLQNERAND